MTKLIDNGNKEIAELKQKLESVQDSMDGLTGLPKRGIKTGEE